MCVLFFRLLFLERSGAVTPSFSFVRCTWRGSTQVLLVKLDFCLERALRVYAFADIWNLLF